jgi:hypothetical protein
MDDVHAGVVIRGLLNELEKSWKLVAAQRSVINQHVGEAWDEEIVRVQLTSATDQQEDFERLYQMLVLGAPESNPPAGWEHIVQRLIESAPNQPPSQ